MKKRCNQAERETQKARVCSRCAETGNLPVFDKPPEALRGISYKWLMIWGLSYKKEVQ